MKDLLISLISLFTLSTYSTNDTYQTALYNAMQITTPELTERMKAKCITLSVDENAFIEEEFLNYCEENQDTISPEMKQAYTQLLPYKIN